MKSDGALAELIGEAYAFEDLGEFRGGILPLLKNAVPCEYASYNEIDDDPTRTWAFSDPPITDPAAVSKFASLAHENPVLNHMRRTRDGRPYRISDFLDTEQFHALALYREFYAEIGVEAQVAFTLPSRPPIVVGIALSRTRNDFSDDECRLLRVARPHLIQAYRTIELASARQTALTTIESGMEEVGTPMAVVDALGRIDLITDSARRMLGLGAAADRLSPSMREALAKHLAGAAPVSEPLLLASGAGEAVARAMPGPDGGSTLLLLEGATTELSLPSVEALGLTGREAEAIRWIALGRTGPEAARLMGIAPRTVAKHLQNAYAKLGVGSRSEAARTVWAAVGLRRPE